MAISDKVAAAKKIDELLRAIVSLGGLRLRYRITVDPPLPEERDWERPEILVELSGPDSTLLLERG
ncbi:MAG: single-stranded DNA-binding protein, partial [Acidobacteriaceae bacterium]|nr:single-stranded DNA-binding protein [Acidobacteriaceae bacterium]